MKDGVGWGGVGWGGVGWGGKSYRKTYSSITFF